MASRRKKPDPADAEPEKYARGMHPASRAALDRSRPNRKGARKPTRARYRRQLVEKLRERGWQGNPDSEDFDLYVGAKYDLEYEKRTGAERSRLRNDLMALADRMQIGHRALGHPNAGKKGDELVVNYRPIRKENQAGVVRLLAATGLAGPELQEAAQRAEERIKQEERDKVARLVHNEDQEEPES